MADDFREIRARGRMPGKRHGSPPEIIRSHEWQLSFMATKREHIQRLAASMDLALSAAVHQLTAAQLKKNP